MPVEEDKLHNLLTKFWEISKVPEENETDDEWPWNFRKPSGLMKQLVDITYNSHGNQASTIFQQTSF